MAAAAWLFLASLFFYGYWMPEFTLLLVGSICANFFVGMRIARTREKSVAGERRNPAKPWLVAGVAGNLVLLGYFKYANFFVDNLNAALGAHWDIGRVVLPIGISFFTFTQIAFLADAYLKGVREYKFIHYGLFVTYFPHLVAGPVLHHAQMMPQFGDARTYRFDGAHFAGGLAIFALGLFKKVVLADGVAPYADAVFKPADAGALPDLAEAWLGVLAYTFQLYFDFSGYSDMAIGISWMFNVRLPFNFNSPYRATNISDFWRRWHISLSNFLRDYLYIALGGNRKGAFRRYANLAITMLLGGLWHGASWSFVVWGGLHGAYLMINHGFRALVGEHTLAMLGRSRTYRVFGWLLTMLAVMVAWVFFRAESFAGAGRMLQGMAGLHPAAEIHPLLWNAGLHWQAGMVWCTALGGIAFLVPNSNRIGARLLESCKADRRTSALLGGAAFAAALFMVLVNTARESVSAFIYFNF
jgi:alginate O-acetyltransferase complex protein AlgI